LFTFGVSKEKLKAIILIDAVNPWKPKFFIITSVVKKCPCVSVKTKYV
jgi:hypothetical protein